MYKIALAWACLICAGHGRRVHGSKRRQHVLHADANKQLMSDGKRAQDMLNPSQILARFFLEQSTPAAFCHHAPGLASGTVALCPGTTDRQAPKGTTFCGTGTMATSRLRSCLGRLTAVAEDEEEGKDEKARLQAGEESQWSAQAPDWARGIDDEPYVSLTADGNVDYTSNKQAEMQYMREVTAQTEFPAGSNDVDEKKTKQRTELEFMQQLQEEARMAQWAAIDEGAEGNAEEGGEQDVKDQVTLGIQSDRDDRPVKPQDAPPTFVELLKFTVAAMPIYISPTLLSLIDTAVVGQISSEQLAAMGPACGICDALTALMVFISIGTTNAVSTAYGSSDMQAAKRAASVSAVMSFAIGCVVAVLLYFSIGPLIAHVLTPAAVASTIAQTGGNAGAIAATERLWASCEAYVKIRSFSFPAALLLMSAQASCLGAKDSVSPTVATLIASVVNVVGDAILVLGPLSMGIAGAAWATVGCQIVAAAMLLRTIWRKCLVDMKELRALPSKEEVNRFFAFGAFILVLITKQVVYNQAILLASILGTAAGAAHQCLFVLFKVCCTLGDVTGATAQSFLPRYYVANKVTGTVRFDATAAQGTVKRIVGMTVLVAAVNTAITFAVPLLKPGLFTSDQNVVSLMRHAAPIVAAGLLMHPSVVGIEGCLLATKDISWLVGNYLITGVLSVLSTQLLLNFSPLRSLLNINTIWIYLGAFQAARFLTFSWRLFSKAVRKQEVPKLKWPGRK